MIDIEVVDAQHDYNILLGCSYMYAMKSVTSTAFPLTMFRHEGKIVTLNQLTYHDPKSIVHLDNVLPMLEGSKSMPLSFKVGPSISKTLPCLVLSTTPHALQ